MRASSSSAQARDDIFFNAGALTLESLPLLSGSAFRDTCVAAVYSGARLSSLVAVGGGEIVAVLAHDGRGALSAMRTRAEGNAFPSLTPQIPQAQAFERELFEEHGLRPEGHPWLKPLRRHAPLEAGAPVHPYFRVEGQGIHEVAVGPVHAGVIEPGHFRFQCRGEEVLHLEIHLGYQHRGAVKLMREGTPARRLAVAETIAGDTSVGHAKAHCLALEALAGVEAPLRAQGLRGIALELERLANHAGDLGALCGDVGFLPGASYYGRLRGEFLNLTLELCGNRFGRGLLVPGGVRFDFPESQREALLARLAVAERDLKSTAQMTFDTPSVVTRFEGTGALTRTQAEELGLVGPAARACGLDRDVRQDHPAAIFRFAHIPVAHATSGDVMARAMVRRMEIERSLVFVREQLCELAPGPIAVPMRPLAAGRLAVALVEGWRGEVAHTVVTDASGAIATYHVKDPSLHNWFGLAQALRHNPISDFPLCNKSFNLSYCGHDL